ncbi:transposase [Streptomyces sp. Mg1]|nr:transposase [Streptomyces sp. Mg1]
MSLPAPPDSEACVDRINPARSAVERSRAGVWGRLHEEILHRLDDAGLIDLSRAVLDSAHVRAKKGANSQVRAPWTEASRAPKCTSCRTRPDCPSSSGFLRPTPTTAKR